MSIGLEGLTRNFTAHIPAGGARLLADVAVPNGALGVVLLAHGTGRGHQSSRNRYVALQLNMVGLATVAVDLLTPDEEMVDSRTAALRYDIPFLADRAVQMVEWIATLEPLCAKPMGLFGAGTGAPAVLDAAARCPAVVQAVVAGGGRTDLSCELESIRVPTLLIVGGDDATGMDLGARAIAGLRGPKRLEVIPGASQLFDEPGALERLARLAGGWFHEHFGWGIEFASAAAHAEALRH